MGYAKAIAKMESIPEGERYLLREIYFDGKDCCAAGLLCPDARNWWDDITRAQKLFDISPLARREAEALELTREDLAMIQEINDCFEGSDEERFEYVLSKLRELEENNK